VSAGCPVRGCGPTPGCLIDACNPSQSAIDSGDIVWHSDFGDCIELVRTPGQEVVCGCGARFGNMSLLDAHWDECGGAS
jgi:hypothetical protein